MTKWIRQQIKSKLFRKLFWTTQIATMIPVVAMTFFWLEKVAGETSPLIYTKVLGIFILASCGMIVFIPEPA